MNLPSNLSQVVLHAWRRCAARRIAARWLLYKPSAARATRLGAVRTVQASVRGRIARKAFQKLVRQRDVLRAMEAAAKAGQVTALHDLAHQARQLGTWCAGAPAGWKARHFGATTSRP